ncbi:MAG: hypothetical protein EBR34_08660 [Sphingomonadaceae bacterium]|nr:hypothetical protein [Sphingomonadaceae bacterium]
MSHLFDTEVGDFSSEKAAEDWAEANGIDLRDIHTRRMGDGRITLSVRRSSLGDSSDRDHRFGRTTGFFR